MRLRWALMYLCAAVLVASACRADISRSLYEQAGGAANIGTVAPDVTDRVQIYRDAMPRHGIRLRERNELPRLLAPMKRDVVEK